MKEIDILLRANSKGCMIVDKQSHVLLEPEELLVAQRDRRYQEEDDFLAPGSQVEISGPFPGCMQLGGDAKKFAFRIVGQTEHFIIFYPTESQTPLIGLESH